VKHHPPEIVLIALIHFAFVLVVLALVFHMARWITRGIRQISHKQNG
jgi:HAMP domain-containing protein